MAFPSIVSSTSEVGASVGSNNAMPLPADIVPGNLLLFFFHNDSTTQPTVGTGSATWTTRLATTNGSRGFLIAGRIATGSDALTISGSGDYCFTIIQVEGFDVSDIASDILLSSQGTNATGMPDAPNLDTGVAADYLWLAWGINDVGPGEGTWGSMPANFTQVTALTSPAASGNDTAHSLVYRQVNASAQNPGAWGTGWSDDGEAYTLAIPPATGGTDAEVDATVVTASASVPSPTVAAGSTATPSVVTATVSVPAPSVSAGDSATATPGIITAAVSVPTATVAVGSTVSASVVTATVSVPAPTPSVTMPTFVYAVVGGVTQTAAVINGELEDVGSAATLLVSTSSNLSSPDTFAGTNLSGDFWTFPISDLAAGTTYFYGFEQGSAWGSFKTAPSGAASFSAVTGSCWNTGTTNAFVRMAAKNPELFLPLGDFPYIDNTSASQTNYLTGWSDALATSAIRDLVANCVTAYTWSDHDYGDNNSDGTESYRTHAQDAYRVIWPSYELPGTDDEIAHTFVWGRVRFIMLDSRSERSPEGNTDNSSKTMLGAWQKQWLKDTLVAATEPLIVINCEQNWIGGDAEDGWGHYTTERAELAQFIYDNDLTERVIFIHGDAHMLANDDGTNNTYGTGWPPGPPVFCFAPFNQSNSTKGGPYSGGTFTSNNQQYGWIEFADDGATITVNLHGFSVTSSSNETERFDVELTFGDTDANISATVVTASVSVPAPTVTAGSSASPSVVTATVSVPAPTAAVGSTATPGVVTASVTVPAPTVTAGGNATVTADIVTATVSVPAPTPAAGSTVTPTVVSATVDVPAATPATGVTASPTVVTASVSIPAPTVTAGSTTTPTVVTATVDVPAAGVAAGGSANVSATVVTATVTVPTPTIRAGLEPSLTYVLTVRAETRTHTPKAEPRTLEA